MGYIDALCLTKACYFKLVLDFSNSVAFCQCLAILVSETALLTIFAKNSESVSVLLTDSVIFARFVSKPGKSRFPDSFCLK